MSDGWTGTNSLRTTIGGWWVAPPGWERSGTFYAAFEAHGSPPRAPMLAQCAQHHSPLPRPSVRSPHTHAKPMAVAAMGSAASKGARCACSRAHGRCSRQGRAPLACLLAPSPWPWQPWAALRASARAGLAEVPLGAAASKRARLGLLAGSLGLGAHASDRLRAPMSWPPQPLAPKQAMARWSCCLGGHACSSQGRALGGGTGARPCGRGSKPSPARAWRLCGHPRRP